ncbi:hypothetical protein GN956_G3202 [Arapaima gigas]
MSGCLAVNLEITAAKTQRHKEQQAPQKDTQASFHREADMMSALFKLAVFLLVIVTPSLCKKITVCQEEDRDVRVDCVIEPKPNEIISYIFSMSKGSREYIVNTNSTTVTAAEMFQDISTVEQLGTNTLRLRLHEYKFSENTTFSCKVNTKTANIFVEKGKMLPCSTISVFFHCCPWLLYLLMSLCAVQSWNQV